MRTFKEYLEIIKESKEPMQNNASSVNRAGIKTYSYSIDTSQKSEIKKGNLQEIKEIIGVELEKKSLAPTVQVTIYGMDIREFKDSIENQDYLIGNPYGEGGTDRILRLDKKLWSAYSGSKSEVFSDRIQLVFNKSNKKILQKPPIKANPEYSMRDPEFDKMKKEYFDL